MIFMEADIQRHIADARESRRARSGKIERFERPGRPLEEFLDEVVAPLHRGAGCPEPPPSTLASFAATRTGNAWRPSHNRSAGWYGPVRPGGAALRSRATGPEARRPWTPTAGSAPSGNPASSGRAGKRPK